MASSSAEPPVAKDYVGHIRRLQDAAIEDLLTRTSKLPMPVLEEPAAVGRMAAAIQSGQKGKVAELVLSGCLYKPQETRVSWDPDESSSPRTSSSGTAVTTIGAAPSGAAGVRTAPKAVESMSGVVKKIGGAKVTLNAVRDHFAYPFNLNVEPRRAYSGEEEGRLYRVKLMSRVDVPASTSTSKHVADTKRAPPKSTFESEHRSFSTFGTARRVYFSDSSGEERSKSPSPSAQESSLRFSRSVPTLAFKALDAGCRTKLGLNSQRSTLQFNAASTLPPPSHAAVKGPPKMSSGTTPPGSPSPWNYGDVLESTGPGGVSGMVGHLTHFDSARDEDSDTESVRGGASGLSSRLPAVTSRPRPDPAAESEPAPVWVGVKFGATRAGAELALQDRFWDAQREVFKAPGALLRVPAAEIRAAQADFTVKMPLQRLWRQRVHEDAMPAAPLESTRSLLSRSTARTAAAAMTATTVASSFAAIDGSVGAALTLTVPAGGVGVSATEGDARQGGAAATAARAAKAMVRVLVDAEECERLLLGDAVGRICANLALLTYWTVVRPRYEALAEALGRQGLDAELTLQAAEEAEFVSYCSRHASKQGAGGSDADFVGADLSSVTQCGAAATGGGNKHRTMALPDIERQRLVSSILTDYSAIDMLLSSRRASGQTQSRPVVLLAIRTVTESFLRTTYPYHFLLESAVSEYLRRYVARADVPEFVSALGEAVRAHARSRSLTPPHASSLLLAADSLQPLKEPAASHNSDASPSSSQATYVMHRRGSLIETRVAGNEVVTGLLTWVPTYHLLDSLAAGLVDSRRYGSHIAVLESTTEAQKAIRAARLEMRRQDLVTHLVRSTGAAVAMQAVADAGAVSQLPSSAPPAKPSLRRRASVEKSTSKNPLLRASTSLAWLKIRVARAATVSAAETGTLLDSKMVRALETLDNVFDAENPLDSNSCGGDAVVTASSPSGYKAAPGRLPPVQIARSLQPNVESAFSLGHDGWALKRDSSDPRIQPSSLAQNPQPRSAECPQSEERDTAVPLVPYSTSARGGFFATSPLLQSVYSDSRTADTRRFILSGASSLRPAVTEATLRPVAAAAGIIVPEGASTSVSRGRGGGAHTPTAPMSPHSRIVHDLSAPQLSTPCRDGASFSASVPIRTGPFFVMDPVKAQGAATQSHSSQKAASSNRGVVSPTANRATFAVTAAHTRPLSPRHVAATVPATPLPSAMVPSLKALLLSPGPRSAAPSLGIKPALTVRLLEPQSQLAGDAVREVSAALPHSVFDVSDPQIRSELQQVFLRRLRHRYTVVERRTTEPHLHDLLNHISASGGTVDAPPAPRCRMELARDVQLLAALKRVTEDGDTMDKDLWLQLTGLGPESLEQALNAHRTAASDDRLAEAMLDVDDYLDQLHAGASKAPGPFDGVFREDCDTLQRARESTSALRAQAAERIAALPAATQQRSGSSSSSSIVPQAAGAAAIANDAQRQPADGGPAPLQRFAASEPNRESGQSDTRVHSQKAVPQLIAPPSVQLLLPCDPEAMRSSGLLEAVALQPAQYVSVPVLTPAGEGGGCARHATKPIAAPLLPPAAAPLARSQSAAAASSPSSPALPSLTHAGLMATFSPGGGGLSREALGLPAAPAWLQQAKQRLLERPPPRAAAAFGSSSEARE